jgi:fibronectin type 3 domain-containing protein
MTTGWRPTLAPVVAVTDAPSIAMTIGCVVPAHISDLDGFRGRRFYQIRPRLAPLVTLLLFSWNPLACRETTTPLGEAPPSAPIGVSATAGDREVVIAWSPAARASSYNIYWLTAPGVTRTARNRIAMAVSPQLHSGLTNGTTYHYVVTAVDTGGESAESEQVSATPEAPPATPTGVDATPGDGIVTIAWPPVAGAASYDLYWSTVSGVAQVSGTRIPNVTSAYVHTGLANGTTYYYVIVAFNMIGESPPSAQVSASPKAPPPPNAPTGVVATPGDGQVTIAWQPVTDATS